MKTKQKGIIRTWNCRIGKRNYVVVYEWRRREAMIKAMEKRDGIRYGRWIRALCYTFKSRTRGKRVKPRKYGEIHVVRGEYGAGVVAHEVQHIVSRYAVARGWRMEKEKDNERIARVSGEVTHWYWVGYYKKGKEIKSKKR